MNFSKIRLIAEGTSSTIPTAITNKMILRMLYPSMFSFHFCNSKTFLHFFSIKLMINKIETNEFKMNLRIFLFFYFCLCFALPSFLSHFIVRVSLIVWVFHDFLFVYYDNYSRLKLQLLYCIQSGQLFSLEQWKGFN